MCSVCVLHNTGLWCTLWLKSCPLHRSAPGSAYRAAADTIPAARPDTARHHKPVRKTRCRKEDLSRTHFRRPEKTGFMVRFTVPCPDLWSASPCRDRNNGPLHRVVTGFMVRFTVSLSIILEYYQSRNHTFLFLVILLPRRQF